MMFLRFEPTTCSSLFLIAMKSSMYIGNIHWKHSRLETSFAFGPLIGYWKHKKAFEDITFQMMFPNNNVSKRQCFQCLFPMYMEPANRGFIWGIFGIKKYFMSKNWTQNREYTIEFQNVNIFEPVLERFSALATFLFPSI